MKKSGFPPSHYKDLSPYMTPCCRICNVLICLNAIGKPCLLSEDYHPVHASFTKWPKDYQLKMLSIKHRLDPLKVHEKNVEREGSSGEAGGGKLYEGSWVL